MKWAVVPLHQILPSAVEWTRSIEIYYPDLSERNGVQAISTSLNHYDFASFQRKTGV
jgi:hypothetical protein